jgi:sulfite reductase (NADPH) flavoprotein alpha-component
MTKSFPPPAFELIPEGAPFTVEQRQWLSGFFAGLISVDGTVADRGITALSPEEASALMPGTAAPAADEDDGAPWHDQSLPMAERMRLAEGRPLNRRMMAAMAQQDCGQCGYNCRDYADALAARTEERLNLCVPGGKETARMLKTLRQDLDGLPAPATVPAQAKPAGSARAAAGRSRDNPVSARFLSRTRLNKQGSEKETWHVEFDLAECGLDYEVGDSFGIVPTNDPALVDLILDALAAPADFPIGGRTLREVLIEGVSLSPAPDMLFQLVSCITGGERRQRAKALASGEDPDGDAEALDVLAAIEKFRGIWPDPEAFIESLDPLQPRLYSISCSPKTNPGRVSTTVDAVRYRVGARQRLGVASTFLAERVCPGDPVKIYVQKAHGFGLPADAEAPIIMIGPGTGIAPFRAFLHERMATGAPGRNWLFFGHQRRDYDFFYEDELTALKAQGLLTRLTLAWSRDGAQKIYVQDRMREVGRDLWAWIADGAHVYVCGDAKRMAKDVEHALIDVVAQHGARSTDAAIAFVTELKKSGRYQQDVY